MHVKTFLWPFIGNPQSEHLGGALGCRGALGLETAGPWGISWASIAFSKKKSEYEDHLPKFRTEQILFYGNIWF